MIISINIKSNRWQTVQKSALSSSLQYNLGIQLFSMLMQLNMLHKLCITINLNSVFSNTLIDLNETLPEADYKNNSACLTHKTRLTSGNNQQTLTRLSLLCLQIHSIISVKQHI